jgi:protein TonB
VSPLHQVARLHQVAPRGPWPLSAPLASGSASGLAVMRTPEADRPVPPSLIGSDGTRRISSLVWSAALHSSLFIAFAHVPPPLPSIGIPTISVEIVLGDGATAGIAPSPGEEGQTVVRSANQTESTPPEPAADQPEQFTIESKEDAQQEPRDAQHQGLRTDPEISRETTLPAPPVQHIESATAEPDAAAIVTALASPHSANDPHKAAPSTSAATSYAPASSGVSRGQSTSDSNYHGRVAAHLARHKRFPADARIRREQGSAGITFSVDGLGRVTDVKLTRSTGSRSLDREAQTMVRRASPFPPPPGGQALSFSVPVSFNLR